MATRWDHPDSLLYFDLPYTKESRKTFYDYQNEFKPEDHLRLLKFVNEAKSKIIISGYDSALYRKHLSGFHRMEVKQHAGGALSNGKGATGRTEVIWTNFQTLTQLTLLEAFGIDNQTQHFEPVPIVKNPHQNQNQPQIIFKQNPNKFIMAAPTKINTGEAQIILNIMFSYAKEKVLEKQCAGKKTDVSVDQLTELRKTLEPIIDQAERLGGFSPFLNHLKTIENPFKPKSLFN